MFVLQKETEKIINIDLFTKKHAGSPTNKYYWNIAPKSAQLKRRRNILKNAESGSSSDSNIWISKTNILHETIIIIPLSFVILKQLTMYIMQESIGEKENDMYCKNCGMVLDDYSPYCSYCGTKNDSCQAQPRANDRSNIRILRF